ncbi:MAG: K+ channel, inward rectifier [bacterium]|nr:K+ channel, inward rectifier [bacterium]
MLKRFINSTPKEPSDLGFGSVVSDKSRERMINADGSFNVTRHGLSFFSSLSPYHHLLTTSWWRFIGLALLGYFLMNLIFAFAYMAVGAQALEGTQASSYLGELFRAFFFSVQTSSTIGYGHIIPDNLAANILVTIESFFGLLAMALATGLVFSRFSRPVAKIIFSKNAIVAPYREITGFMFRIANARKNQLLELGAQVFFSCIEEKEGQRKRTWHKLELERTKVPFFPLSWTIVHPIDKKSPLYNITHEELMEKGAEFMILLSGMDDTFNQTVFSRSSYKAQEVIYGVRFSSIFENLHDHGPVSIDISRLSDIEQV